MRAHIFHILFLTCLAAASLITAACDSGEVDGTDGDEVESEDGKEDGDADQTEAEADSRDNEGGDGDLIEADDLEMDSDGDRDFLGDRDTDLTTDGDTETDGDFDPEIDIEDPPPIVISKLFATENPANLLSFFVEWETDRPARSILKVTCEDEIDWILSRIQQETEHNVFVMGLLQNLHCVFSARTGEGESKEIEVDVGTVPAVLPALNMVVNNPEKRQPGWTLLNLNNSFDNVPLYVVVIDELARYRWYHRGDSIHPGDDTEVAVIPEGILIGGNRGKFGPAIINWEGRVLWEPDLFMHHDIRLYGPQNHLLYLSTVYDCEGAAANYYAASIVEYDRLSDQVIWEWRHCDHYVPPVYRDDWSHCNAILPFPGENALLLSSREQHNIVKIDRDTDQIDWILGLNGDFEIDGQDRFMRQHAPEILPNGNILLFDNGDTREPNVRQWSRALEISYSENTMTAEAVWSFRPDPDIYSWLWGDADRLANGNTLITFGMRSSTAGSNLIEVNANAKEVWHMVTPVKWGIYRADRIDEVIGYVISD